MTLQFNRSSVKVVEFGVGREREGNREFRLITVDGDVQDAIKEMVDDTWDAMVQISKAPSPYEPSEKHGSEEYLFVRLRDTLVASFRELHQAHNIPTDPRALDRPEDIELYFARLIDNAGNRLVGLKRAGQFKGIVKARLIQLHTNALKLVDGHVFRLDKDFDVLVDARNVHILRPVSFELMGNLQDAVLTAVGGNLRQLSNNLPFVDIAPMSEYIGRHPRAARYLASICSQETTKNIDQTALVRLCKSTKVAVQVKKGQVVVSNDDILGFLEVLDRRRYELELVRGAPEQFIARSRRQIPSR
jgi:hypothetical protein